MSDRDLQAQAPFSVRLAPKDDPLPTELPLADREARAKARVNTVLKGYRLVRLLGVGPVSAAYEGVRGTKDATEHAAVRVMNSATSKHDRAKSVFLRSAYAANRFQHARVLPIIEDGTDDGGAPFIVRPWSDAEPLDVVCKKRSGSFGEPEILRVAEQVLDALEMAHAHGIVHGALTPSNILVTPRGSIRLCDFSTPPGLGGRVNTELDGLTELRVTPFTAPERCATPAQSPSEQSDVYSLGACLYLALSGKAPRGATTSPAELARTPATPLREVAPSVSESIASVVDHALAFDPIHRYESAYAMLGDVRRVMAGRRPKLSDSAGPIPSQSALELSLGHPASSRRVPLLRDTSSASTQAVGSPSIRPRTQASEWRGNIALILAIALLVGVATFVVVREKVEEMHRDENGQSAPPTHGPTGN